MSKYCVKKPFTVLVAVVMVIVLGVISFMNMTTDLLPAMELPYVVVVTTYPGASPEKVETAVTAALEAGLGTVNGVTSVTSSSSENVSMVVLEFENGTNMDSAMVNLSTALDQVKGYLPDTAQNPMLLQLSPDMLPVMIASADMEGMDIYQLTEFANENLIPAFERQAGVASVSGTGLVERSVEIRLDEEKIEAINTKVLASVNDKLADAKAELDKAQKELADGRAELESGKAELEDKQAETADKLADASAELDSAIAQAQALASQETALNASKAALEMELGMMQEAAAQNTVLLRLAQGIVVAATTEIPGGQPALVSKPANMDDTAWNAAKSDAPKFIEEYVSDEVWGIVWAGVVQTAGTTLPDSMKQLSRTNFLTTLNAPARVAEIETELANLSTELAAAKMMKEKAQEGIDKAQAAYKELEAGKLNAAAGFGSGAAQMAAAETSLKQGEEKLKDAREQFEDAREEALKNADMSQLLTKDMVAKLVMAQNFAMPAGYLYQGEDQYLLKVGDAFASVDELENALLLHMEAGGVGDIRLSDVAAVTLIDNSGESYARVNGNVAVALSIQKSSTASTSAVSKAANAAIEELEAKYPGLRITPLMDQGDYIKMTVDTVLSNLGWGALLAILVLALFLKDLRPTGVVAFSIPISLMFAVVLMYFSGVTLNMISLSGLALGVGMLVDNSIVVMENIYRLRGEGMPAARAAVKGAKQVAGAIAASTLTTVCVFLPIVFTSGITRQLFVDMGLTIAYSLAASLLVALTVVPALSSTLLRTTTEKGHPLFDRVLVLYEKALDFCLRFKAVPLGLAVALLGVCVWHTAQMGMEFMPSMGGNQVSATLTLPDDTPRADAYAMADEAMDLMLTVDGVETVGAMEGGGGMMSMMGGGSSGNKVESVSFYLLLGEKAAQNSAEAAKELEALSAQLPGCEIEVSTSNMDLSALGGSGLELIVRGRDLQTLNSITQDLMEMLFGVEGLEAPSNGQEEGAPQLRVVSDKDAAMRYGLTVAQIYSELSAALTTETTSTTLTVGQSDYEVNVVDERELVDRDNLMNYEFETSVQNEDGETVTETHPLSDFASLKSDLSVASVSRENQQRYMTVTAATQEGYNTTLVSRQVEKLLAGYSVPDGYTIEIGGETQTIADAMGDLVLMILLAVVFIYLIMVAQFQSLLSPFIVMFTMPLAFTGGLLALWAAGQPLSVISMLGFLILAGIVVNNGIVFVDYTNQLRLAGMEKRAALLLTGKARIRPILMTALTTILAMSTMVFSKGMGAEMAQPMALVTIGGLAYATLLTLFVVPVLYDLLFRRQLKNVDVGEDD